MERVVKTGTLQGEKRPVASALLLFSRRKRNVSLDEIAGRMHRSVDLHVDLGVYRARLVLDKMPISNPTLPDFLIGNIVECENP